jgi:hypothetical protein
MVPIAPKYQWDPLVVAYMSSMSHNKGGVTKFTWKLVSKFKNFSINDDEGVVGGLNYAPCMAKPSVLITLFFVYKSCALFMVSPNLNLGVGPMGYS